MSDLLEISPAGMDHVAFDVVALRAIEFRAQEAQDVALNFKDARIIIGATTTLDEICRSFTAQTGLGAGAESDSRAGMSAEWDRKAHATLTKDQLMGALDHVLLQGHDLTLSWLEDYSKMADLGGASDTYAVVLEKLNAAGYDRIDVNMGVEKANMSRENMARVIVGNVMESLSNGYCLPPNYVSNALSDFRRMAIKQPSSQRKADL